MGMEDPGGGGGIHRESNTKRKLGGQGGQGKATHRGGFPPKDRKWTGGLATPRRKGCGSPRAGKDDWVGNAGWGQRVELGDGTGNPWKFPI